MVRITATIQRKKSLGMSVIIVASFQKATFSSQLIRLIMMKQIQQNAKIFIPKSMFAILLSGPKTSTLPTRLWRLLLAKNAMILFKDLLSPATSQRRSFPSALIIGIIIDFKMGLIPMVKVEPKDFAQISHKWAKYSSCIRVLQPLKLHRTTFYSIKMSVLITLQVFESVTTGITQRYIFLRKMIRIGLTKLLSLGGAKK